LAAELRRQYDAIDSLMDNASAKGEFVLTMLSALAQFEGGYYRDDPRKGWRRRGGAVCGLAGRRNLEMPSYPPLGDSLKEVGYHRCYCREVRD
jgi:hypothetical protein